MTGQRAHVNEPMQAAGHLAQGDRSQSYNAREYRRGKENRRRRSVLAVAAAGLISIIASP